MKYFFFSINLVLILYHLLIIQINILLMKMKIYLIFK